MGIFGLVTRAIWITVLLSLSGSAEDDRRTPHGTSRFEDDAAGRRRKSPRDPDNKLVVTTILEEPYMMLRQHSMGAFMAGNDRFEGYMADILKNLSLNIGFEYEIRLCLDRRVGESDLSGNWNGMMGEIQRGEADLAVGPITVTPERLEVVDFTDPFMAFRSTALIRKPHKRWKHADIETAQDLLESNLHYGVIDNSITHRLMRTAEDPLYRSMFAQMSNFWPTTFVQSVEEGKVRASQGNYSLILDSPAAEYIVGKEPCEFHTIEPFLPTRSYAIAMRKNDELRRVINAQLRIMRDSQYLTNFYLKWWRSSCNLYIPRPDLPTDPPEPVRTTRAPQNRIGKRGYLASGSNGLHCNNMLVYLLTVFITIFGFHYHEKFNFGRIVTT